jgi:hypothetical protein
MKKYCARYFLPGESTPSYAVNLGSAFRVVAFTIGWRRIRSTDAPAQESEPNRGRRFRRFDGRIDGVTAHSGVEIQTLDPVNLQ